MNTAELERLLLEDPIANVMALKFLSLLGAASEGGSRDLGGRWATWFHYEPWRFAYDAKMYPEQHRIIYWNSNDAAVARESERELPSGLVKASSEPCLSLAGSRWPQKNSFRWFSTNALLPVTERVAHFDRVDESFVALSAENGYTRESLAEHQRRGCHWFVAPASDPQAICYIQPNYGSTWEVSGVLVRSEFRGRGLAKAVVTAALNVLIARGLVPRYFVHDENSASLGVARSLGLEEKGRTVHFARP